MDQQNQNSFKFEGQRTEASELVLVWTAVLILTQKNDPHSLER